MTALTPSRPATPVAPPPPPCRSTTATSSAPPGAAGSPACNRHAAHGSTRALKIVPAAPTTAVDCASRQENQGTHAAPFPRQGPLVLTRGLYPFASIPLSQGREQARPCDPRRPHGTATKQGIHQQAQGLVLGGGGGHQRPHALARRQQRRHHAPAHPAGRPCTHHRASPGSHARECAVLGDQPAQVGPKARPHPSLRRRPPRARPRAR